MGDRGVDVKVEKMSVGLIMGRCERKKVRGEKVMKGREEGEG